jgi:hypothetical protein
MSTYAAIYNSNLEPLTDGAEVGNDPAEWEVIETKAVEFAAAGTKCCIRWSRESDGQVAYWGPRGATLKPHWYRKPGRPEEMQDGKRRNVYIDDASWQKANVLGNGNASKGLRIALSALESELIPMLGSQVLVRSTC